jgi:hypothetical protein
VHEENGYVLWNCSLSREKRDIRIEGNFLVLQIGYFIFSITGDSPLFVRGGIMYLARKLYPDLTIAYITEEEIRNILESLSKAENVKLLYSKFVAKKMFGEPYTGLGYTKAPLQQAFKIARNEGLWIDNIRVYSEEADRIDFRLSRAGYLVYRRGNFELYYRHVLTLIEEYCSKRLKIFEKRGRREIENKEPKPILVQFDADIFQDTSVRKQLIDVISKYDFCNFSVIHNGNPHVYMNIVDRVDNSTYSLRTYGPNALVIVPQIKATAASLMRFSKHLMDEFREGNILDFAG